MMMLTCMEARWRWLSSQNYPNHLIIILRITIIIIQMMLICMEPSMDYHHQNHHHLTIILIITIIITLQMMMLTCMEVEMFSRSLRIWWRSFVPRMFRRVVCVYHIDIDDDDDDGDDEDNDDDDDEDLGQKTSGWVAIFHVCHTYRRIWNSDQHDYHD